jgi:hypothetical protein
LDVEAGKVVLEVAAMPFLELSIALYRKRFPVLSKRLTRVPLSYCKSMKMPKQLPASKEEIRENK